MRKLRIICYPPDDAAFDRAVRDLVTKLEGGAESHDALAAALVEALRGTYPSVRIRSRDPIAPYSTEEATWYVYRDGHPARSERGRDIDPTRDEERG